MNMNNSKRARERDELQELGKRSKSEPSFPTENPVCVPENHPASSSPAWGGKSTIGRRSYQQDAFVANQKVALSTADESEASIFGVFDGHGGSNVSEFLAHNVQDYVQRALLTGPRCKEAALKEAFVNLDASLPADSAVQAGSTALLVVVDDSSVVCANCGDSRAVLCRGGQAIALSNDHKPDREDEEARIERAGGRIFNYGGARRVMGVLSMSRAIGDTSLRLHGVIPEPEVTIWDRHPDDEFLLLASDGLWDALSNEEAIDLAKHSLRRALSHGASRKKAAFVAAAVLVKKATDRGSGDNITVLVVDLQTSRSAEQIEVPSPCTSRQLAVLPFPATRAIGRAYSYPTRVDQVCKGSNAGIGGCTPSLLSAERLLLVSASSAPPALLVLAS